MQTFGVARIGLFGSAARENQLPKSDIDLLVEFLPEKKTYKNFLPAARVFRKSVRSVSGSGYSASVEPIHEITDRF